jgi:hypothetical protein
MKIPAIRQEEKPFSTAQADSPCKWMHIKRKKSDYPRDNRFFTARNEH